MRRLYAAIAVVAAIAALGACGGDGDVGAAGKLTWTGDPVVEQPRLLPRDRLVSGRVTNTSLRPVEVSADDVRLEDADGRTVPGVAIFSDTWAKPIIASERRQQLPREELQRIGKLARIEPGAEVPLTVAWRGRDGERAPVRVVYGVGWLPLPGGPPVVVEE